MESEQIVKHPRGLNTSTYALLLHGTVVVEQTFQLETIFFFTKLNEDKRFDLILALVGHDKNVCLKLQVSQTTSGQAAVGDPKQRT